MRTEVERPENETEKVADLNALRQPDYTDTELRDIRYRLNAMDHKLDTVLSKLDWQDNMIRHSDNRWQLVSVFLESIEHFMKSITDYMQAIKDHYTRLGGLLNKIIQLMRVRALMDSGEDKTALERIQEIWAEDDGRAGSDSSL